MTGPGGAVTLPERALADGSFDVLMIGSSSTAGVGSGVERAYPAVAGHLLAERLGDAASVRVVPRGVGGERADGALSRLAREIDETRPDLLVWQVGTNDAVSDVTLDALEQTVTRGIAMARDAGIGVILIDPQFYPRVSTNPRYADVVAMIDRLGDAEGVPVVRRFERMRRAETLGPEQINALLAKDAFHMSPLGHECLARDLTATILSSAALDPRLN
ncbi:SGNH/GDSL hydrolase family protein [Oceanicella sp. SM1341]|uniref:SGNH/GDSL hydrolase family protein n=1 Tax=Oceanicella sp. SM1341 TaxID=1548889 RepID=UPI001300A48B|nr:SGNH/GDSL hydrolase family protein [Oceanicella sp. SM1341]